MYIEKILKNKLFLKKTQNIVEKTYDKVINLTRWFKKDSANILKELLFGLSKAENISLSEIWRYSYKISRWVKLKNIVSSYSKFLRNEKVISKFMWKFIHKATKELSKNGEKVYAAVDGWDMIKEFSKSRNISYVRDGSTGKQRRWYVLETVVAFNTKLESVPLLWELFSRRKKYKSDNNMVRKVINKVNKYISKNVDITYLFDRWYDAKAFFEFLSWLSIKFIVKMRRNRYVKVKGKTVRIDNAYAILRNLKEEVEINLKGWKKTRGRLYYWQIKIFDWNERRKYWLVVLKNNKWSHILLTNEKITNKKDAMEVITAYSYRRIIEETYKYMKQEYDLEYMHIRDSKKNQELQMIRMNNLYNLLLASIWLSMLWLEMLWKQDKEILLEIRSIDYIGYRLKNLIWWWLDVLKAVIMKWNFLQSRTQRYRLKIQQKSLFCLN